jgi:hypothetical protein
MNVEEGLFVEKECGKVSCVLHESVEKRRTLWVMNVVDGDSFTLKSFVFTPNLLLCAERV